MKISKRQLKRIIREEKQRILLEMNPQADANRSLGVYANVASVDALTDSILNILQEVDAGLRADDLEDDEAEELARNAAILAVAQAFQSAGAMDVYYNLLKMLR